MSKHFLSKNSKAQTSVRFIDFWLFIANELGSSRLKINTQASSIHRLIDTSSDHNEFLRDAIKLSYRRSRCHHLKGAINLESVLDILGETAFELQGQQRDDLFDIELLEEIAWLISQRYGHVLGIETQQSSKTHAARIVSFPAAKIRRANALL